MRCFFFRNIASLLMAVVFLPGIIPALQGCSKPPAVYLHKNVLLISIDTCRADHIQPYSNSKAKTPNLQEIAQEGSWFEDAVTPVPLTLPAHCSLLTGLHPIRHGVRSNYNYALSSEAITLAELFQESGYTTAAAIGSIMISRQEGISQGFEYFDDRFTLAEFKALQPSVERRAERVVASAAAWLQTYLTQKQSKPFFLFLHFYDPHMLYQPPEPYKTQYAEQPYDGEIAYVDACIGQLRGFLRENGLYDDLLLFIVGDHGEGLNDHGDPTHGLFLYDEAVRVPFIVKPPKEPKHPMGRPIRQGASLVDITPTLIDLCGLGQVESDGISLKPWLVEGKEAAPRNLVLETQHPLTYNWSPTYALRNSTWKYIHAPQPELYNLANDPQEKKNLIAAENTPLKAMQAELENRLLEMAQAANLTADAQVTSDRMETLASLGYAAGGPSPGVIAPDKPLPDPKEKLGIYLLVDQGLGYLARGLEYRSIDLFDEARRKDPNNPTPYMNLGLACAKIKQWEKAVEYTEKAVELSPQNLLAYLQLTRICVMSERLDKGRKILESVIKSFPQSAEAHYQMGELLLKQNEPQSAMNEFEQAKRWMPDMPGIDEAMQRAKNAAAK